MKIVKSLVESVLLVKDVSETTEHEAKEQKGGFLCMLLGPIGAILLGNMLAGKGVKAKIPGQTVTRAGEGTIRAGQDF